MDIFLNGYPEIDLHGYDRDSARVATDDFIYYNYLMGIDKIIIVHGKGMGIVRNMVHDTLKNNKYVKSYKVDNFNPGITIVELLPNK